MYLVNLDETGRVLGCGWVNLSVLPKALPDGTIAVECIPPGRLTDYRYQEGQFVRVEGSETA